MEPLEVGCGSLGFLGRRSDTIDLDHGLIQCHVDGSATLEKHYNHVTGHAKPAVSL